jgi:hypothetical protein
MFKVNMLSKYSEALNKLYSKLGAVCGINLQTDVQPPCGTVIRFMPVFAKFEHIQENIVRCPNHTISKEFNNESK